MDIPTFQIWCPHIHTPLEMSIIALRRPSTSIPLWLFLIFFISALFIVFCIYCTHLFQKYKFTLCLTVQNHSEIASKFTWTLASSQKSYFVSNWLARTRIHSHLLRLHSHLYSSSRTHSHTANIPLHLFILTPHTLHRLRKGRSYSRTF